MNAHRKCKPTERFEAREAAELRPLPEAPYDYGAWKAGIKFQRHYRVNVDGRDYSVPYRLIGEAVSIKTTAATVKIYPIHRSSPFAPAGSSHRRMMPRSSIPRICLKSIAPCGARTRMP
ncbi:hypothetical protein [Paracoccus sp. J55]|uniref:Mu transposase domain-containing protein n=1 Tax=Paracoccus sp. J55 TaxID=935849 RepID=UPI0035276FBE